MTNDEAGAAVAVRGLGLAIGGARILFDVTLAVGRGETLGVIGPNGAGKTTLFNVITGVLRPTAGTVMLDGVDVTGASIEQRARRGLGRTFQTSSLFPQLDLVENVRLAAQARAGNPTSLFAFPGRGDAATRQALECLEAVGLADASGMLAGGLSHGDKRKLEIAVLLATGPSVVLLDEPMAGVGSGDVPALTEIIRTLHTTRGCTVLIVEHHLEVVLGLVDRVAVLHHGQLLACDTPAAVMADETVQQAYLGETV